MAAAVAGAALIHGAVLLLALSSTPQAVRQVLTQEVEIDMRPPPPAPAPKPRPRRARPKAVARAVPADAPKAAAAQAGAVLTATSDVVDFTDEIVTGKAARYAGGTTASDGTSAVAVHGSAAGAGVAEVDRSRPPALAQGAHWKCPFPRQADDAGVDEAFVTLKVAVDPRGQVTHVKVVDDPGHGFAREAELCAYEKRWAPGLDRGGKPKQGTALVRVRFIR